MLLKKYILAHFWKTILMVLSVFVVLVCIVDLIDHLDDFINQKLPFMDYVLYYLYTVPTVAIVSLPFAVLLGAIRLFRQLSVSNEYIALIMGGISLRTIMMPLLFSCLFLSLLSVWVNDKLEPETRFKRKVMQKEKFKLNKPVIHELSLLGKKEEIIYVREYHKQERTITGLMVSIPDQSGKIVRRLFADKAIWSETTLRWELQGFKTYRYEPDGTSVPVSNAEPGELQTLFSPHDLLLSKNDPKYLNLKRLRRLIRSLPEKQDGLKQKLWVDYHRKIAISFLPLVILFMGVGFGIAKVRDTSSRSVGVGIMLALAYYVLDAFFYNFGQGLIIPPIQAAWASNAVFLIAGLFVLKRAPH